MKILAKFWSLLHTPYIIIYSSIHFFLRKEAITAVNPARRKFLMLQFMVEDQTYVVVICEKRVQPNEDNME
jgi:hypothetical protein